MNMRFILFPLGIMKTNKSINCIDDGEIVDETINVQKRLILAKKESCKAKEQEQPY